MARSLGPSKPLNPDPLYVDGVWFRNLSSIERWYLERSLLQPNPTWRPNA